MSISLYSAVPNITAPIILNLTGAGNYALTDIDITFLNGVPVASGTTVLVFVLRTSGAGVVFHTGGLVLTATAGIQIPTQKLSTRTFPDSLVLPRGLIIQLDVTSFVNMSAANLLINLSGTVTP